MRSMLWFGGTKKGGLLIKTVRILFLSMFGFCSHAFAGSFQAGIEAGMAYPADGRFNDTEAMHFIAGYEFEGGLLAGIGAFQFGDFELSGRAAKLEIEGLDLHIGKSFALGRANAELGIGVFYWDAKALLEGLQIGEDSGSSALFDVRISLDVESFSFYGGGKHLQDVAGNDINLLIFGSRFSF